MNGRRNIFTKWMGEFRRMLVRKRGIKASLISISIVPISFSLLRDICLFCVCGEVRGGADIRRAFTAGAGGTLCQTAQHSLLTATHPNVTRQLPRLCTELCQPAMQRWLHSDVCFLGFGDNPVFFLFVPSPPHLRSRSSPFSRPLPCPSLSSFLPWPILRNFSGCTISKVHVWCNALTPVSYTHLTLPTTPYV